MGLEDGLLEECNGGAGNIKSTDCLMQRLLMMAMPLCGIHGGGPMEKLRLGQDMHSPM